MNGKRSALRLKIAKTNGKRRDRPKEIQRFKRKPSITKKQYITPLKAKLFLHIDYDRYIIIIAQKEKKSIFQRNFAFFFQKQIFMRRVL
jgi:hypothetical protein